MGPSVKEILDCAKILDEADVPEDDRFVRGPDGPRVFHIKNGKLRDVTKELGLSDYE